MKIDPDEQDLISGGGLPDKQSMGELWLGFGLLAAFVTLSLIGSERQRRLDERLRATETPTDPSEQASQADPHSG